MWCFNKDITDSSLFSLQSSLCPGELRPGLSLWLSVTPHGSRAASLHRNHNTQHSCPAKLVQVGACCECRISCSQDWCVRKFYSVFPAVVLCVYCPVCSMRWKLSLLRGAKRGCAASSTGRALSPGSHWWVLNNNLQVPFSKGPKSKKGMEGMGTLKKFMLQNLLCWEKKKKNLFSMYYSVLQ